MLCVVKYGSTSSRSVVQRSHIDFHVSECDGEVSTMRTTYPTIGCCSKKKNAGPWWLHCHRFPLMGVMNPLVWYAGYLPWKVVYWSPLRLKFTCHFWRNWTVQESKTAGSEILRTLPDRPWGPPSLLYYEQRGLSPGGEAVRMWR